MKLKSFFHFSKTILFIFFILLSTNLQSSVQKKCEVWIGSGEGSHSSQKLEMTLCYFNDKIEGKVVWISKKAGTCTTSIKGSRDPKDSKLYIQDIKFLEYKANPGWRFCLTEEYILTITGKQLHGDYSSKECDDNGSFNLRLR